MNKQLMITVAHHLGDGWRVDARDTSRTFIHKQPFKILCWQGKFDNDKGRIIFVALYPKKWDFKIPNENYYRITVSENRSAQSIAKDLSNRCIRPYLETFKELEEKQKKIDEEKEKEKAVENLLTKIGYSKSYNRSLYNFKKNISVDEQLSSLTISRLSHDSLIKLAYMLDEII